MSKSTLRVINNATRRSDSQLFEEIISIENLYDAFVSAKKTKRNRVEVFKFENNLCAELEKLHEELKSGTYKPLPTRKFNVTHAQKTRVIEAPRFRDSVVQHAIYKIVYPLFDRTFIYDSYGCRIGKGTHRAADRVQQFMRQCDSDLYYVQLDFKRYYYNINHEILTSAIRKTIKCSETVTLMTLFYADNVESGLGIGNLLSQLFGLIYLNHYDHYIKRVLKCNRYVRYVDDSVVVGLTLPEANKLIEDLVIFCEEKLKLSFSKIKIHKIKHGINFCGFRTWKSKRFIRKRSLNNFSKAVKKKNYRSIQAILEHSRRTSSYFFLLKKIMNDYEIVSKLPKKKRRHFHRLCHSNSPPITTISY